MGAGLLFIGEPLKRFGETIYFVNWAEIAVIWIRDARIQDLESGAGTSYTWVRISEATYVNVYHTSNCTAAEFEKKIDAFEAAQCEMTGNVIVAGDFNTRAKEWDISTTDSRGRSLLETSHTESRAPETPFPM